MRILHLKMLAACFLGASALSDAAMAADYSPAETPFQWSGVYFGAHGGYGSATFDGIFDSSELPDTENATFASDLDAKGFLAGAQAGINVQQGALVFGIETDLSLTKIDDSVGDDDGDDVISAELDYLASLRARIGGASGPALFYATLGLALSGGVFTVIDELGEDDEESGSLRWNTVGGVVGGGVELAAGEHMSFRVEGLYYMFGEEFDTSELTDESDDGDFLALDNLWAIRAAVNFRL
jgi:outer membrane immunogenic protein